MIKPWQILPALLPPPPHPSLLLSCFVVLNIDNSFLPFNFKQLIFNLRTELDLILVFLIPGGSFDIGIS